MNPTITVDFLRLHFNSSSTVETALSVNAIELVTAANNTSKKNRIPANVPNPMLSNTFGIVININDGPACSVSGSPPENAPHQLSYVTHSGEGEGLLFFGNVILPFVDHFPKDLELYRILTTRLSEVAEAQKHE